jgi:hypothetical protein
MNESINLRPVIRETMQMAPQQAFTIKALFAQLRGEFPNITEVNVQTAVHWNQAKGYVNYSENEETGQELWKLTEKGLATS